jgi:hypothetical protein
MTARLRRMIASAGSSDYRREIHAYPKGGNAGMRRIFLVMATVLVLASAAPVVTAHAQQGYPGSTTSTAGESSSQVRDIGLERPGHPFTAEACGFQPGSTVNVSFNGGSAGTATVDSSGCVHVAGEVLAACPQVRINGIVFTGHTGANSIVNSGTGSNGASRTVTVKFNISCAAGSGTARTGANILRWVIAALALIAVGAFLIVADRRRAHRA